MPASYLTAFEHQSLTIGSESSRADITVAEAETLSFLGESRPGFCQRSYGSIRLAQYCGLVTLGNRVLEILPKIDDGSRAEECRGMLLRMLSESENISIFRHVAVGHHLRHARLLEVFISAFLDIVANLVRGGLIRQYQEHEEDLQVVRGKIITNRQFTNNANRGDTVACRFDELTIDNRWNRLLKVGLFTLRPWIHSPELKRRWMELMFAFDEVSNIQGSMQLLDRLVLDRQAARYRSAIDWVRWILGLFSPDLRVGHNNAPGLLFDMNVLFESVLAVLLRRRAGPAGVALSTQETGRFLATITGSGNHRAFGLRPDLLLRHAQRVVAIGDVKWKRLGISKSGYLIPDKGDVSQIHGYAAAYECDNLALIYPWHTSLVGSKETAFELPRVAGIRPIVSVLCVDLHNDPFALVRGLSNPEFGNLLAQGSHLSRTA
jgi:5-methylcytosine-specific restriction enzyme subunit McrC